MFVRVKEITGANKCRILSWGHTKPDIDQGFKVVDQEAFITEYMSEAGRIDLLGLDDYNNQAAIKAKVVKWVDQTGIEERIFFSGTTAELAAIAAKRCLAKIKFPVNMVDAIIGATNTGPGYPSLADHVKLSLGSPSSIATCSDVTEACTAGAVAIWNAWCQIRSGACKHVLVVCAEKATTLTHPDNWIGANLFGDAAFAVLLGVDSIDSFEFFDGHSMPFDGNLNRVMKTEDGFKQDGPEVHKFVGKEVAPIIVKAVHRADIEPSDIAHFVPHQPSGKTLSLLFSKLRKAWPNFSGMMHQKVQTMGNLSSASTGYVISQAIDSGIIKPGERVVLSTFGSGLSIFNLGFQA